MSDKPVCSSLFEVFLYLGTAALTANTIFYLIDKTTQHDDEIEKLFS